MSNVSPSNPLASLPTRSTGAGVRTYRVDLPTSDLVSCQDLAFAIADALARPFGNIKVVDPRPRAGWTDPFAKTPYPRSGSVRILVTRLQQYRGAPYSRKWDPSMELISPGRERWLDECAFRQQDLQAWVVRKELAIFTSARIKARNVAPGTYLHREDAIRYCRESGFEVRSKTIDEGASPPNSPAQPPPQPSTQANTTAAEKRVDAVIEDRGRQSAAPTESTPFKPYTRLLRAKEAILRTGLSRSSFYERQNPKSRYFDAAFPSPVQIGQSAMGYRDGLLPVSKTPC